jgi:hypothetical protein
MKVSKQINNVPLAPRRMFEEVKSHLRWRKRAE